MRPRIFPKTSHERNIMPVNLLQHKYLEYSRMCFLRKLLLFPRIFPDTFYGKNIMPVHLSQKKSRQIFTYNFSESVAFVS